MSSVAAPSLAPSTDARRVRPRPAHRRDRREAIGHSRLASDHGRRVAGDRKARPILRPRCGGDTLSGYRDRRHRPARGFGCALAVTGRCDPRHLADALSVLELLARRNRDDFEDEEESGGGRGAAAASAPKGSDKKTEKSTNPSDTSKPKLSDSDSGGRWKEDKPSGAEIVQPEPPIESRPRSSSGDGGRRRS